MRKFLVLGILLAFLTAGFVSGQEFSLQQEQQEQGQPLVFQYFGTTWIPLSVKVLASFDALGVKVVMVWARDMNGVAGIIEMLLIVNQDASQYEVVGGWIQPYSDDEQGFYLKESGELSDLMKKKGEAGEQLEWKGYDDQEGNPILEFYTLNAGGPTGGAALKVVVRTIDIKKFVEEHFKALEK